MTGLSVAEQVRLPEALGFLGIYACYAITVLFDRPLAAFMYAKLGSTREIGIDEFYGAEYVVSPLSSEKSGSSLDHSTDSSPRDTSAFAKPAAFDVFRVRDYHTGDVSYDSDSSSLGAQPPLQRKSSAPTPRSKRLEAPPTVHTEQHIVHLKCGVADWLCGSLTGRCAHARAAESARAPVPPRANRHVLEPARVCLRVVDAAEPESPASTHSVGVGRSECVLWSNGSAVDAELSPLERH